MRDSLLYAWLPYTAATLLLFVPVWRCCGSAARRAALPALGQASARLYRGSRAGRIGLSLLLLGHAVAFLAPRPVRAWDSSPSRLLLLEGAGLALGLAALFGLLDLLRARRPGPVAAGPASTLPAADLLLLGLAALATVSGLAAALLYRWGSAWYAVSLLPYYRSLVRLQPDISLVLSLPPLVRLHLLSGVAAVAVLPFTRVPFALLGPPAGLWRRAAARPALARAGRVLLALAEVALVGTLGLFVTGALRRVGVSEGYAPAQPIAFSHRIHAGDYRVPCLYCHFAAEKSRHAGIPPEGVCMNCHGQLRVASAEVAKLREAVAQRRTISWVKVHNLPDFVYFNHSQHVIGGIACQRCHGPVETMDRVGQAAPLTMGWCLDCHRREGVVPPSWRAASAAGGHAATGGMDCSKCHY
jgi:nitrate reductase gamma subunit